MSLINEHTILLALQSLTRSFLIQKEPTNVMPLPGMTADEFAYISWDKLEIDDGAQQILLEQLQGMFPAQADWKIDATQKQATPDEMACKIYVDWKNGPRNITYKSSGTSGIPKTLTHTYAEIQQEVSCLALFFKGIEHIVIVTPQHICYGFTFGVLMHKYIGSSYTVLPPFPTILKNDLPENTLVVGYPGFWSGVRQVAYRPKSRLICLSAGSPWPDDEIRQLEHLGYANIMEIYGSSENGAIGYRASPHEFTLLDYWKYHQPSEILRVLPTGEHKICPVQDKLSWLSERKFCPVRRLDNAVQVCGINVYPLAISKLIESHPLVKACRVRLMRPEEGSRLKAFVVPKEDADTMCLHKELKIFCKSKMSASERPVKFTFGAAIAVNGFGKETDWT